MYSENPIICDALYCLRKGIPCFLFFQWQVDELLAILHKQYTPAYCDRVKIQKKSWEDNTNDFYFEVSDSLY